MEIHLAPSLNPDGWVARTRNNANDKEHCSNIVIVLLA